MIKPWEIRESDERTIDSIITFIIFCEDKVSEPIYLKYFETSKIKINFALDQKNMMDNVLSAITHCKENGLLEFEDGKDKYVAEKTKVWCVFDRDKEETFAKVTKGNTNFNESIKTAESSGINVAWSNDSFEIWILLHFEDIEVDNDDYKSRITYYNRLTEIFRNIDNPNEDLIKVKTYKDFNYKNSLKCENNFRNIVRTEIIPKTKDAINRAKALEDYFKGKGMQNHEKSPCTLVHHLVEELIIAGGKEI